MVKNLHIQCTRSGFSLPTSQFIQLSTKFLQAGDEKNARTVTETSVPDAPAFVEFLIVILKGQDSFKRDSLLEMLCCFLEIWWH